MSEAGSSQSDIGYLPSTEEATRLVNKFAEVTGTDTACAQFYLQDRDWDLQRSLDAFFAVKKTGGIHVLDDGDEPQIVFHVTKDVTQYLEKATTQPTDDDDLQIVGTVNNNSQNLLESATTKPPTDFRMISWNVDGLDERNLKIRTKAVIKHIEQHKPDIVFLQEVVPKTLEYFEDRLPQYKFIPGETEGYFTVTMLNICTIYYDSHEVIPFPGTTMDRNLLKVEAHMGATKLKLLNSHLESTGDFAEERMEQLRISFHEMTKTDEKVNVIFGGDLNLRDKELYQVGGPPPRTKDAWEACGARKECQYTWDNMRNTNKSVPGNFKPRFRFDRVFCRPATSHSAIPKFFGLIGLQKIAGYQCFPSDHWGLLVDFDAKSS